MTHIAPVSKGAELPALSAADVAFLERCCEDLDAFFVPRDQVVDIVPQAGPGGEVELVATVVVSGRPGTFSARGETILEAYANLRAVAPEQRVALAFRALVDPGPGR
jgi:hypothetical protein